MVIKKYGVVLESLTLETAYLVRVWRNDPLINKFMDYRREISMEEQKQWFSKIQDTESDYFLIRKDTLPIGMIHIDEIDHDNKSAHVGLFIGEAEYHGTGVALAASLCILDYAFETLNLNSVLAKVKNDNNLTIEYNRFLGFEKEKDFNDSFSIWKLSNDRFKLKREGLLRYVNFL